jgi:hypothetical protein
MRQRVIRYMLLLSLLLALLLSPFASYPVNAEPSAPGITADTPSFTKGPDQFVVKDAGAQSVSHWATNIITMTGQECAFLVSTPQNMKPLFSAWPDVDLDGTLTYTPAAGAIGRVVITIYLGCGYPDTIESAHETFLITIGQNRFIYLPVALKNS